MSRYFIDDTTTHGKTWPAGYIRITRVANVTLNPDDIIFAHTTDYNPFQGQSWSIDALLRREQNQDPRRLPIVVFFNGNKIRDSIAAREEYRKELGFPSDKVHFFCGLGGGYTAQSVIDLFEDYLTGAKPPSEALLALKLFCEAWVPPDGQNSNGNSDLRMFAPRSKEDWLKPFGIDVGSNSEEWVEGLSEVIEQPALKDRLKDLLGAIESNAPDKFTKDASIASAAKEVLKGIAALSAGAARAGAAPVREGQQ